MNGAEVGVLKEPHQVCLRCFLQRRNGGALEAQIGLKVLCNLPHKPLEGQLPYEELSALLVLSDLPESNSTRPEPVWLLHSSCCRRRLPRCFRCQLLAGSLSPSRLPCCLLCTGHSSLLFVSPCFLFTENSDIGAFPLLLLRILYIPFKFRLSANASRPFNYISLSTAHDRLSSRLTRIVKPSSNVHRCTFMVRKCNGCVIRRLFFH
ncbi:hypothetical protein SUGI_0627460 [Cryptomeria japonica]|nr:hypothetical protein SUGI_0627460 [Cryptomeria japonica]